MKFKETVYLNQAARESQKAAWALDTMEAYLEKTGDHVVFAGAGIYGANVQSAKGRYLFMAAVDGLDTAVMTEAVDGKEVVIEREQW